MHHVHGKNQEVQQNYSIHFAAETVRALIELFKLISRLYKGFIEAAISMGVVNDMQGAAECLDRS
jgi:hypothetical protein